MQICLFNTEVSNTFQQTFQTSNVKRERGICGADSTALYVSYPLGNCWAVRLSVILMGQ